MGSHAIDRRSFLATGAAAAAALALFGCSSESTPDPTTPGTGSTPGGSGAFPVTIDGALGSITLDRQPQRIVSVGQYRDTDAAVALGVVPLATPDLSTFMEGGISPWVKAELNGEQPELFDSDALPFERIVALQPDLILATDRSALDEEYTTLSEIAPTLSYRNGYNEEPWELTTERIGTALGRKDRALALVDEVKAKVARTKADHPQFEGKTFTFGPVSTQGTITTINSVDDASAIFLSQLGLVLSPKVLPLPQAGFPGRAEVSLERLDLLDADVVILTYNSPAARQQLEARPLFQQIPAVQRGSYIGLDLPVALAMGFPSALSIPYGLDQLVPELERAIKA